MTDKLWRAQDVAEFLNTTRGTVYSLVFARQIPFYKVGTRRLRFSPEEIQKWLEEQRVSPNGKEKSPW